MAERSPSASEALQALAQRWRDETVLLRRRGAAAQAEALESAAAELQSVLSITRDGTVSLRDPQVSAGTHQAR